MKWPIVSLSDGLSSAEVFTDGNWVESKDQDPEGDVRLVQLADVGDGVYINKSSRFLTSAKAEELKCTFLQPGDILVARMPEPLGRACIFPGDTKPSITVVDICIIRVNRKKQDARWLMHCLNAPLCRNQIADFATGTTRSRISRGNLAKIKIPLTLLHEQRRIADILDRAEALKAKRRAALAQLDTLTQAIFLDLFGEPIRNERAWPTVTVADVCELVRGSSPRPQGDPRYFGGPVPRLMVADITRDGWLVTPRIDSLTIEGAKRSRPVPAGTVVMAVSGNVGLVSRLAIDACVHDGFVAFAHLNEARLEPGFLLALLHLSQAAHERSKAGAIFINLTTTDIKAMRLPTPPLALQREFACRVAAIEKLKTTYRASLADMDALFASLQYRAFRGEL